MVSLLDSGLKGVCTGLYVYDKIIVVFWSDK